MDKTRFKRKNAEDFQRKDPRRKDMARQSRNQTETLSTQRR
jgi:hypothetical protein